MAQTFVAKIDWGKKKNTAGIEVPAGIVEALGKGKKPPVKVTVNGYTYRSTVATMGGRFLIALSAENREAADGGRQGSTDPAGTGHGTAQHAATE